MAGARHARAGVRLRASSTPGLEGGRLSPCIRSGGTGVDSRLSLYFRPERTDETCGDADEPCLAARSARPSGQAIDLKPAFGETEGPQDLSSARVASELG
jgi:hypothetical protein